MKNVTHKLAAELKHIAEGAGTVESAADSVLSIVRENRIRNLAVFDGCVKAAYTLNGWKAGQGKPKTGEKAREPVPGTVKQYVSRVRAAFRAKLHVGKVKSMFALRQALAKKRGGGRKAVAVADPAMQGVRLLQSEIIIGAPFHDLAVIYAAAKPGEKEKIVSEVTRVLRAHQPVIPLRAAA